MKTLVVGRSPFADIVVADPSIAPHHAELVLTEDGRIHLTDCATAGGTWLRDADADADAAAWQPVRQTFVRPDASLRLGDYECTVAALLKAGRGGEGGVPGGAAGAAGRSDGGEAPRRPVRGRVERDPSTGEIVRRRP